MPHKQYSKRFIDEIIGLNKLPLFKNSPEGNHIFFKFSKNVFSINKIANFISTDIEWVPINSVDIQNDEKESVIEFLENLEDDDDVQNVFSNVNLGNI